MAFTLEQLLNHSTGLVSLPAVAMRLNQMVDDPNATVIDIGHLISQDPALTIRLLKLANSPFYGLTHEIDTISRAVTVIGIKPIRDLVLATEVTRVFDEMLNEVVSMEAFWRHSIYCGLAARMLAGHCLVRKGEFLFICGLLHDIGRLLIYKHQPKAAHEAFLLGLQRRVDMSPTEAEKAILGYDHADVGGGLAQRWQLPQSLQSCILYHHNPAAAGEFQTEASIVHIANTIAHMAELDTRDERDVPPIQPQAWERIQLTAAVLPEIIEKAQQQVVEVESLLLRDGEVF